MANDQSNIPKFQINIYSSKVANSLAIDFASRIIILLSSIIPISNPFKVFRLQKKFLLHESNLLELTVIALLSLSNVYILKKYRKLPPRRINPMEKFRNNYTISNEKRAARHFWSKSSCSMQTNGHIISRSKNKNTIIFVSNSNRKVKKD